MISRALLLAGAAAAGLYLARTWGSYGGTPDDHIALLFAVKLFLVLAVALHCLVTGKPGGSDWTATVAAFCARHTTAVLTALIVVPIVVTLLSTPQIGFGNGRLGPGYGHDGVLYGRMAEEFGWFARLQPPLGRFGYRFLPSMLVHYSGLDTFTGFRLLNLTTWALASVLAYRVARDFALPPFAALLVVALLATLKFGLKFLVYYPVITDGLGLLLLMAIIWATLEKRHVVYVLAMAAAAATRENLLALVLFNALHLVRTGSGRRRFVTAAALQLVPVALFAVSRYYPVFPQDNPPRMPFLAWNQFVLFVRDPGMQTRFLLAYVNSLGVLAILPLLSWQRVAAFLGERYEWAYYVAANVALSTIGGSDFDRFAIWLAPAAGLGLLAVEWPRRGGPRVWIYLLLLHLVAMEVAFPWLPEERFYHSRYAAHLMAPGFAYMAIFTWVLVAAVAMVWREEEPAAGRVCAR